MELPQAIDFLAFLIEKQAEEMIWQRWLHHQNISFMEFKGQLKPKIQRSEIEILEEVKEILETFKKGRKEGSTNGAI